MQDLGGQFQCLEEVKSVFTGHEELEEPDNMVDGGSGEVEDDLHRVEKDNDDHQRVVEEYVSGPVVS